MTKKNTPLSAKALDAVRETRTEDYNRINRVTLENFPRNSCPVDLYHWQADVPSLTPIYRAGRDMNRRLREQLHALCESGQLFFSRTQINAYVAYVGNNLDTAMEDPNLTGEDKADLFVRELKLRQEAFYKNPMPEELNRLKHGLEALCTYLREESRHMARMVRDVHANLTLDRRRINASLLALAVYMEIRKATLAAAPLQDVALGFFLYDIGMTKISPMMLAKPGQLTPPEMRTVQAHPRQSVDILRRLNLTRPEVYEPAIQHHERLSGKGYPNSLSGTSLGLLGRIAGVADSYCAMITPHPRRTPLTPVTAAEELVASDHLYDQDICKILVLLLHAVPADN